MQVILRNANMVDYFFSKTALPMTIVVALIVWAWISFISVILYPLF